MKIGITELLVIFAVALFAFGPDRLPVFARKLGEALSQFKRYSAEATKEIKESIVDPLERAQEPLREAMEPLTEVDQAVRENVKDVKDSFAGLGKRPPKAKEKQEQEKTAPMQTVKEEDSLERPLETNDETEEQTV